MDKLLLLCLTFFSTTLVLKAQNTLTKELATKVLLDSSYHSSPRVLHRDIKYLDLNGKLISVHIIEAKLKKRKLILEAATPFNSDSFARQSVPDEMIAETASNHKVIAGINADFFNMKTGVPLGIVVKDGRLVKQNFTGTDCFVGVRKNGQVVMGDSLDFKHLKATLTQALGAKPRLIKEGKLLQQDSSGLSRVHHPRSALGVQGKRTVIFVTVDGRQPNISNGISLTHLAKLMQLLGADNAVNLDGGGSTTLAIQSSNSDTLKVANQPSGKILRKVANAWVLIQK